jgi:hypothetical protein
MSKKPELRGRAARLARLLPSGPSQAARTPFVLLVVLLLGGGLITLLILNSSLNEGSFQLSETKRETTELTDQEQELQRDVDAYAAPDALQRRARELGMVPGGDPAFLNPNGTVSGVPGAASRSSARWEPAPRPQEVASPAPSVSIPVPRPPSLLPSPPKASPAPAAAAPSAPSALATPVPAPSAKPGPTTSGR